MSQHVGYNANPGLRWTEALPWVAAGLAFFLLPEYLSLGARILTYILFALSLDLIIGYAGIITLVVAGLLGLATGAIILRMHGLTQLMLTLAIAALCLEVANKATPVTGGADGLSGVVIAPIFGMFSFDMFGKTAYLWCLFILLVSWWLVRRLIYSPFGVSLTGIRENSLRMHAIGAPVDARLRKVYTLSATMAGMAGALLTQTNQFVGLNVLGFEPSGELLVMLILGGVGRLYGAFVGPLVFLVAQDFLAKKFPEYWYFGIGLMLVLVVLFARGGILGLIDGWVTRFKGKTA